jgi:hypothetical protein
MPTRKKLSRSTNFFRGRPGFNVAETAVLLVLLAALAVVIRDRYVNIRSIAYGTSIEGALRGLTLAEEEFLADHERYGVDLDSMNFTNVPGVTVRLVDGTKTGWSAQAAHTGTHRICALFIGTSEAVAPATKAGVVACK